MCCFQANLNCRQVLIRVRIKDYFQNIILNFLIACLEKNSIVFNMTLNYKDKRLLKKVKIQQITCYIDLLCSSVQYSHHIIQHNRPLNNRFALHAYTYMWVFFNKYSKYFSLMIFFLQFIY